jgi:hypothetical protein
MARDRLQIPATLLGMTGALAVAQPLEVVRAIGFLTWIGANSLWVIWGVKTRNRYLVILFVFYAVTAAWGLITALAVLG